MPTLPLGYTALPPGMLANVVVSLEMLTPPKPRPSVDADFALAPMERGDLAGYRALFRQVGEDWLWFSRLVMPDDQLAAILGDPRVESLALVIDGKRCGLLELDFREAGQCELAFFGVVKDAIGTGAGRWLMNRAITRAWARPIRRFWVHTCTHDHPAALDFYLRSGFRPFKRLVEVHEDPRLSGHLPRAAAPHIPLIEG
jgi:GNAT superfamily N-acetyltransferase